MATPFDKLSEEEKQEILRLAKEFGKMVLDRMLMPTKCDELVKEILLCLTYDDVKELKNCVRETIKGFELEKNVRR